MAYFGRTWVTSCKDIKASEWDKLMLGKRKISYQWLIRRIKKRLPKMYDGLLLNVWNPYSEACYATKTHYILTHSMTEYFIKKEQLN